MENKNTLGNRSHFIDVDMERAYKMLATGLTVDQVALELGISRSTLYRRHREYRQSMIQRLFRLINPNMAL